MRISPVGDGSPVPRTNRDNRHRRRIVIARPLAAVAISAAGIASS